MPTLNAELNQKATNSTVSMLERWLRSVLSEGVVTVTFTKKDGTERVMNCTTSNKIIPAVIHQTNTDKSVDFPVLKTERRRNPAVAAVYDIEAKAWKSFRWDSIKQVSFELK
jgi:SHS2 domain-containing protein